MCKFDLADKQTCKQTEMIDLDRAVASRKAQPFLKKVKNSTISHKKNAAIDAPDGSGAHLSKLGSEPEHPEGQWHLGAAAAPVMPGVCPGYFHICTYPSATPPVHGARVIAILDQAIPDLLL